ncbi:Protein of unknown function [Mesorhizobium albiziae]|uniref:DUF1214 domain-containing protein n=1 Tax=Neomesorhizobium albiziae TaxID=335020 RepID=A0A1I3YL47_9HYPH|nr:DUF1214 domain-containing protein [Mesorhizobium albiziae]GLS33437.1 hypothetical protein GCM10007937_51480 [Mesorhizobium albiziae]SFK32493.1 Protein of unknown function [Mesorhizobium albiziae]
MNGKWVTTLGTAALLMAAALFSATAQTQPQPATEAGAISIPDEEAQAIARDAYVYAYPLMLTNAMLRKLSNFAEAPPGDAFGPPNQFHHARAFPNPDDRLVIRTNGGKDWVYTTRSGTYGTDYLYRAAIAQCCVGENLPQDAVYPSLSSDSEGPALDGGSNYVLHFDKGKLPPVDAFWSVTAYDIEGYFIPNSLKRQAIGDRDKLVTNSDGSVDIYVQATSPGSDKEANWLPVGKGPVTLPMRLYSPREEFLKGAWAPPPVKKVD